MPQPTLAAGLVHEFSYRVPEGRTVPALYPDAAEFQQMPRVFATGYLVGLVEWTCIQAVNPHLDWPAEQTVGTRVDLSHAAPTPPGGVVTVRVELEGVEGRKLRFRVSARDEAGVVCEGSHERFVVDARRFAERLAKHPAAGRA
jgi:fluoroacetyl-CoA thioesterase